MKGQLPAKISYTVLHLDERHLLYDFLLKKTTLLHCRFFICQTDNPKNPIFSDCERLYLCAPSLFSVRHHWSGILHRAWYCLTYGFCSFALSRKQSQAESLRMKLLVLIQFPSYSVVFNVSWMKLGYHGSPTYRAIRLSAGSLVCYLD